MAVHKHVSHSFLPRERRFRLKGHLAITANLNGQVAIGAAGGSIGWYLLQLFIEAAQSSHQPLAPPFAEEILRPAICATGFFDRLRALEPWDYVIVFLFGALLGPTLDLAYIVRRVIRNWVRSFDKPPYKRIA